MPVTNPNPSILRRIFGDPVSDKSEQAIPGLRAAWTGRQYERPDLEQAVTSIRPMSIWKKWQNRNNPDTYASTNPFLGSIQLDMDKINANKQDLNDVLIHEMTHATEGVGGFLKSFYDPRYHDASINNEAMRKVRKGDIEFRSPKVYGPPAPR